MAGTSLAAPSSTIAALFPVLTDSFTGNHILFGYCTGTPDVTADTYAHGCLLIQRDSGTGSAAVYQNIGSSAVPSWSLLDTASGSLTLPAAATDATTTTTTSLALTQNTVTSGTGFSQALNGLTTGKGQSITHTTAVIASGGTLQNISSTSIDTATTTGALQTLTSTASLAGTQTLHTYSGLTTGIGDSLVTAALTSGTAHKITATAATLTTGRYASYNDGALEVFGVGANGHIHTAQTTAPTIAVTQQNGITAAAITAGSSDTCGTITTTGTNNAGGTSILQITFGKTYTTAPKAVILQALNTSAAKVATTSLFGTIVSAKSATTFDITIPSDAAAGATPSWTYLVIA